MDVVKTWIQIVGMLALCIITLAWYQTRQSLGIREAELARLKGQAPPPEATPSAAPTALPMAIQLGQPARPIERAEPSADPSVVAQALVRMTSERDRYKDGLQRCVDEANRVAQGSGQRFELPPLVLPTDPAPKAAPKEEPHISALYSAPTVTPLDDKLLVTGTLFNTGKVEGRVAAAITILHDGKPVMTEREMVSVPAQGQASWSHTFHWRAQEGAWTAVVRVENP